MPDEGFDIVHDGTQLRVRAGQTVFAALWSAGMRTTHRTAHTGEPRAGFCGIGVCFDCIATIDGVPNVRSCLLEVRPGMTVDTQQDAGSPRPGAAT